MKLRSLWSPQQTSLPFLKPQDLLQRQLHLLRSRPCSQATFWLLICPRTVLAPAFELPVPLKLQGLAVVCLRPMRRGQRCRGCLGVSRHPGCILIALAIVSESRRCFHSIG